MEKVKIKLSDLKNLMEDNDVFIDSPHGISKISDVYRKNGPGKELTFTDESVIKCANDHLMCDDDNSFNWKSSKNYKIGEKIDGKEIKSITNISCQEWIDFTVENESSSYYHNQIIHHNSGKSLIVYFLYRYCVDNNLPLLITVPSTSLCEQLYSDFQEYVSDDHDVSKYVSKLYGGKDKTQDTLVYISTWQTCSKMPKGWLSKFRMYICDEAHGAKATEITKIIDQLVNCPYRIGLTGTLDGSSMHELEMNGRFGEIFKMTTTRELMDRGIVTELSIRMSHLKYSKEIINDFSQSTGYDYQKEISFLIDNHERNQFILKIANSLPTTTLMLFNRVEAHGLKLLEMLNETRLENLKSIYFISGSVKTEEREIIRKKMDSALPKFIVVKFENGHKMHLDTNDFNYDKFKEMIGQSLNDEFYESIDSKDYWISSSIAKYNKIIDVKTVEGSYLLLASYGTLSTGVNIKNLHNLIFCHSYKGKILNLQSIGRILRKSGVKNMVYLYDILDDLRSSNNKKINHTYKHGEKRIKIYEDEDFDYKIRQINVG